MLWSKTAIVSFKEDLNPMKVSTNILLIKELPHENCTIYGRNLVIYQQHGPFTSSLTIKEAIKNDLNFTRTCPHFGSLKKDLQIYYWNELWKKEASVRSLEKVGQKENT